MYDLFEVKMNPMDSHVYRELMQNSLFDPVGVAPWSMICLCYKHMTSLRSIF